MASESDKTETVLVEGTVSITIPAGLSIAERLRLYDPKLNTAREIVSCSLRVQTTSCDLTPVQCLDCGSGPGLQGLLWKKRFGEKVHVVVADKDGGSQIQENCRRNNVTLSTLSVDSPRRIGELFEPQKLDEIHMYHHPANIVLHREAFDFVFLQPPQSYVANHLDAVFSNIRTGGTICLISPDMSSLCFRSPQVVLRQFHAHVIKTEYVREMAVRVLVGAMARSAARCCRSVEVLCSVYTADSFLITVRVVKGSKQAESCMPLVRPVLHCLMCEERVVYPETNAVIESPYSLMPCGCHSTTPGKTAVLLGPMWVGPLFSVTHLQKMTEAATETSPNSKLPLLLQSLIEEAKCFGKDSEQDCVGQPANQNAASMETSGEQAPKKQKTGAGTQSPPGCDDAPLFCHNLHKKKFKGLVLPRCQKLISQLQQEGYRASRTHFETKAIKTNATASQILHVIKSKNPT